MLIAFAMAGLSNGFALLTKQREALIGARAMPSDLRIFGMSVTEVTIFYDSLFGLFAGSGDSG